MSRLDAGRCRVELTTRSILVLVGVCVACGPPDDVPDEPTTGAGGTITRSGETPEDPMASGGTSNEPPAVTTCLPEALCSTEIIEPCEGCSIDDLEDGDGYLPDSAGPVGNWFGYHNAGTFEPVGAPIDPERGVEGASGNFAMAVRGERDTGVALLGLDLARDGDDYGSFDASAFSGLTFRLSNRGEEPLSLHLNVNTRETTGPKYGGTCPASCDPAYVEFWVAKGQWLQVVVPWESLEEGSAPFSPLGLTNLQFIPALGRFDFAVDDLAFLP